MSGKESTRADKITLYKKCGDNVNVSRTSTIAFAALELARHECKLSGKRDKLRGIQMLNFCDHNQILGRWYVLYAGWRDAPLRGEWVRSPKP
eukprot:2239362-Pleurochrysis_carterae.AAC.1